MGLQETSSIKYKLENKETFKIFSIELKPFTVISGKTNVYRELICRSLDISKLTGICKDTTFNGITTRFFKTFNYIGMIQNEYFELQKNILLIKQAHIYIGFIETLATYLPNFNLELIRE